MEGLAVRGTKRSKGRARKTAEITVLYCRRLLGGSPWLRGGSPALMSAYLHNAYIHKAND